MKDNVLQYKGYFSRPEYSVEDKIFYGTIMGINDAVDFQAEQACDVEREFMSAVDDYLDFCKEIGKAPEKAYNGVFNVRIPADLHRDLTKIALSEGVSINKIVEQSIRARVYA